VPVSHLVIVEFLFFSNVLFLFSACFHAFHRNLSFIVLGSNSYKNEMSVARSRFSAWHSAENIERSLVDRREWPVRPFLSSTGTECSIPWTVFSSLLCSIYHNWKILSARSHTHRHKLRADANANARAMLRSTRF